ncbi:hypothetical protein RRG08_011741 [Elysia crispata]|uniref:GON domain-containing protein n=1 Tax=Elysia crispata TaxID=231223 RepID=A0AAE1AEI0_9GAST|nr:hypothetical protein RRG08_011741 [Elysia crispata]
MDECSVSCNHGIRSRAVKCMDRATRKEVDIRHCQDERPRNTRRCYRGRCPRWRAGRWGKCSVSCGIGERKREVRCVDKRNRAISPVYCPSKTTINTTMTCKRRECTLYNWQKGLWSQCSHTCGFGKKHRSVTCVDQSGSRVSSHLCDTDRKPRIQRRCSEFPCPFIWNTGPWSECSTTCGEGRQERTVTCQAVTPEGWILDGEVPDSCRQGERPSETRYCNYGHCSAQNHWTVKPWRECSAKCGYGRQRRLVICTNKEGKRIRRNNCYSLFKPVSRRPCYSGNCYARSCLEFKRLTKVRKDGDYKLRVGDKLRKIYCRRMRSREPKEYISLTQSPRENYAEVFGKRLRQPNTCPNDGKRPSADCEECRRRDYSEAKNATFAKIRIDLPTLTIIPSDKTFSSQSGRWRRTIPYGSAGDCYSANNCPQGRFSINLVDTGFAISNNSSWTLHGNRASQRIWRLKDGKIIRGMCGGYCGVCFPDPKSGLKVVLADD